MSTKLDNGIDESNNQKEDTAHIYRIRCNVLPLVNVSREGCGWQPDTEGVITSLEQHFKPHEMLKELKKAVVESGGQDLAQYMDNQSVKKIQVVIPTYDSAEFYFHCDREMSAKELHDIRVDFSDQLSDGWGEGFEQGDFNLESQTTNYETPDPTDENEDPKEEEINYDIQLGFQFDWKNIGEIAPYDPKKMRSLVEIEQMIQEPDASTSKPRIR